MAAPCQLGKHSASEAQAPSRRLENFVPCHGVRRVRVSGPPSRCHGHGDRVSSVTLLSGSVLAIEGHAADSAGPGAKPARLSLGHGRISPIQVKSRQVIRVGGGNTEPGSPPAA